MKTTVTVCILTCDAESTLRDALHSVQPHADEIVVLDSGSRDHTFEIALSMGAKVYHRAWDDDFSSARNAALEMATSDWILFLDADEQFSWELDKVRLGEFLAEQDFSGRYVLSCRNIEIETGELLLLSHVERLFRRGEYRYEGRIHERLVGESSQSRLLPGAHLVHTGYSARFMVEKGDRNLRLLLQESEREPENGLWYRYLANEYYNQSRYEECRDASDQALQLIENQHAYSRAQAYYYGTMARLWLGEIENALETVQLAQAELPDSADLYGLEFELRWQRQEWQAAIKAYETWGQKKLTDSGLPQHLAGQYEGLQHQFAAALREAAAASQSNNGSGSRGKAMEITVVLWNVRGVGELRERVSQWRAFTDGIEMLVAVQTRDKELARAAKSLDVSMCEYGRHATIRDAQCSVLNACRGQWVLSVEAGEQTSDWETVLELLQTGRQADGMKIQIEQRTDKLRHTSWQTRWVHREKWLRDTGRVETLNRSVRGEFLSGSLEVGPTVWNPFLLADFSSGQLPQQEIQLRQGMYFFAIQHYREAGEMLRDLPVLQAQFYQILSDITLGLPQSALSLLQSVINEADESDLLDFCYLYAKTAAAIQDAEVKEEAVELIKECFRHLHDQEAAFLVLHKSDLLRATAELLNQTGDRQGAMELYYDAMVLSEWQDAAAFYSYLDLLRQTHAEAGNENDLPRVLMKKLAFDEAEGKRLLYLAFCYYGTEEWAELFAGSHESTQFPPSRKKVSVVLPVYNQADYLGSSIESVLNQTHENLELIIVDDGSTEDIKQVVSRYKQDKRIRYQRLPRNTGLPNALNTGLKLASGDYLMWHSADNLMHALLLERLTSALEYDPACVAAYADYGHIDESGNALRPIHNRAFTLNGMQTPGPAFLWRASVMERVQGFDRNLFGIEDRDFATRVRMYGEFSLVPENLYSYRVHNNSLSADIDQNRFGGWGTLHALLKQKWFYLSFI